MRRYLPDLPWISAFPELNVRTYVERNGRPGVWFLSLDATNALAVWAARRFFHLPYHRADMTIEYQGDRIDYRSHRAATVFEGSYRRAGDKIIPRITGTAYITAETTLLRDPNDPFFAGIRP